jgi:hypothetical protein
MLTLIPGSSCDVCAEEYGPHCLPHSIPCGHVLCASCCNTIVEKTSSRLTPVCPFCREQFTSESVRLIRTDFTTSGWSTPRGRGAGTETNLNIPNDAWARNNDKMMFSDHGSSRNRAEARRLEDKVAKVAAKKCSVEEVSTLHKELQDWLTSEVPDDQTSSLSLSAALLRAILMNHLAHSEASRFAKTVEAGLRDQLESLEMENEKNESELRKQKLQYAQKAQECQTLRTELSRLKIVATTLGAPPPAPPRISISTSSQSESRRQSATSPIPPSSSPTPPREQPTSPLRYGSSHSRSVSMSTPLRSSTPSVSTSSPSRTQAPSARSHTPSARSQTPSVRSHTPSHRSYAPSIQSGTSSHRSHTPAPPLPPKPHGLAYPEASPIKMTRSSSGEGKEKETLHQLWIPPPDADMYDRPSSRSSKFTYPAVSSSSTASPSRSSHRYTTVNAP